MQRHRRQNLWQPVIGGLLILLMALAPAAGLGSGGPCCMSPLAETVEASEPGADGCCNKQLPASSDTKSEDKDQRHEDNGCRDCARCLTACSRAGVLTHDRLSISHHQPLIASLLPTMAAAYERIACHGIFHPPRCA